MRTKNDNSKLFVSELKLKYFRKPKPGNSFEIRCSSDAYEFLIRIWDLNSIEIQEKSYALFLSQANEVLTYKHFNTGTLNSNQTDLALITSAAILSRSAGLILAHNHPSGNIMPSKTDKQVTMKLNSVLNILDISFLDHLIITDSEFFSFNDAGLL